MKDTLTADERYDYEAIKRCVSGDGWRDARVTPSSLEVFEDVNYHTAFEVAERLVADGVLVPSGLHEWRRV